MNKITPLALGVALATSSLAYAEEGFRQHGAHVHGQVEFNIAQDGNELLVEITAPGADVVGFEHAPTNDAEKQQLKDAVAKLSHADHVFTLTSEAGCKVEHQSVTHTLGADKHDHDEHHDHDKHDHEEHHDHDKHDHEEHHDHDKHDHDKHDHDEHHDHDNHDHESGGHGEFTVEYHYQCDNVSAISNIETSWFSQFPSTESIKVNLLTDTKQAAMELKPGQKTISF
ncbi:zinc uptake protein ZrgA [Vibrio sp. TRT 29B02]|uniref:zinc uptake protein ZrgA n=1 Tax=Vibrio sp. TRT 29B02 TaxID=3418508 RepID=UPI003CF918C3